MVPRDQTTSVASANDRGDVSITAIYTSQTWRWAAFDEAELLATSYGPWVFHVANTLSWLGSFGTRPSLRHSLLHRHAMIDRLVQQGSHSQVLEIAAGLSRRGASLSRSPTLRYVELDLPHMVDFKERLLAQTPRGREILQRPNFERVRGDARTTALESLVDTTRETCVVVEGLLMYLTASEQRTLWRAIAELLRRSGGVLLFDLVPSREYPRSGALGGLLEWSMKRFTRGRGFELEMTTREQIVAELRNCGFGEVRVFDATEVARAWNLPAAHVQTQVVLFAATVAR